MGLGGPMIWWDVEICTMLARAGFLVVRFDNRDTGRSSRLPGRAGRAALARAFLSGGGRAPYTLDDMAQDAFELMDHLGWASAHVTGASMGGMIAQTMAVSHPERVRSLTSVMSTVGRRTVGFQHPSLLPLLLADRGPDRESYVAASSRVWQAIGSPAYRPAEAVTRAKAEQTYDRGVSARGVMRQMLAVLHQPDRTRALGSLRVPTAVIHGAADKMVHVSGGRATARAVPGAELVVVDGMGHDLPVALYPIFVEVIRRTADRWTTPSP